MNLKELIEAFYSPRPKGKCVICGRITTNTKNGDFVCAYEDNSSLGCGEVWNDRILRQSWPPLDNDPREHGYDDYRQEEYDDYQSYISSYDWQVKADAARRAAGYRCQRCGKRQGLRKLQVHHKHYRTLYHESKEDIEVLCSKCHKTKHSR